MAGTSRSARKQPLNDGSFRRSWKVPTTEEEWLMHGRTFADHPITEEEHSSIEEAFDMYVGNHGYQMPTTFGDRPTNPNPPSSQVMPLKLKESCRQANLEIGKLQGIWRKNRDDQLAKEAEIQEKKHQVYLLQKEIMEDEQIVRSIKESYTGLEEMINDKAEWIINCQNIYPEGN